MNCIVCGSEATHLIVTLKTMTARAYCVPCMREKLGGGDAKGQRPAANVAAVGGARRASKAGNAGVPAALAGDEEPGSVGDEERAAVAPSGIQAETAAAADGQASPVVCVAPGCKVALTPEQVANLTAIGQPLYCVDHQLASSRAARAAKKQPKPTAEPYGRGATR